MKRRLPLTETHIVLRILLSAGVLAVLLACAGAASEGDTIEGEIRFTGTAIEYFNMNIGGMVGAPWGWIVCVNDVISGPQPCNNQLNVTLQAVAPPVGYMDPNITEGDMVEVYGCYYGDQDICSVSLAGHEEYHIRRLSGPQNISLVQVEGQPEVYWFQNGRLYWVTDWNVINDMSGVPGWGSVNTLPASEFDPATYPQGPRFITTGAESNDLLIREQGDIKVYLILNGEKHHFTSPEALTWNGYGFDDVIEVSSTIVGMFPEGTPISIQEKHLLRKPGGTHVFWSQNGELYYVTADALDKMLDIHGWGWDEINEPADFNPEDPSHYKTFITTDPESNGVLIRLWDGYKVYRIEDGFRRHITYPDVMELKGYAMEGVIDVSQDIISMFPLGDPIGIEVNLTFNKTTDSGEEPCTKFTTGETVKFYTETTVSESYTVDTYVKLIEPDGRTRYAYYTDLDFHPTDQLSFSDTEVPLYPGHWDAISKNWNWHEYVFDNDVEGVYTGEFYYRDVISGKVLGWDRKAYSFNKKTDLGIKLDIGTNKYKYNKNEYIALTTRLVAN